MSLTISFAARTDMGHMRKSNQDSGYAGSHLLVLADGMGGPAGGDIASSIAVAHLAVLDADTQKPEDLLHLLRSHIADAHAELIERSGQDAELHGLGTTCIAILRSGNKLAMTHIGDSRAYLLRGGELNQVTTDHSFVQYLVESGQITPEQAENHPQRSVLLRVLGDSSSEIVLDESLREAIVGDRWMLCSDGLSGVVSAQTIAEVLLNEPDPGAACDQLVDLALKAGGPDNVTVVIGDIVETNDASGEISDVPQIVGAAATDRLAKTRDAASSAGRANQLTAAPPPLPYNEDARPHRSRRTLGIFLGILAFLVGGGFLGWTWTQSQFYVSTHNGKVAIYQGIPQKIGGFSLSHLKETTNLQVSDLEPVARRRLQTPVTRSSLSEARQVVRNFEREHRDGELQKSQNTGKSTSPSNGSAPGSSAPTKQGD
ncbi:MAG: protein phosphatase 2C domain-containing protein [Actinomycetaceae bacterium]|nr:protein phosphatase 2C domain-containing protein [Actinomycetaceae bacterium]